MTKEAYNKATALLKEINVMENHVLGNHDQSNANSLLSNYSLPYPYTYPFRTEAYSYMNKCLPRPVITEFFNEYKKALDTEFERLKQEFTNL